MSEQKWTPGPWRVGAHGPNGCYTVGTQGGLMAAMVAHSVDHDDQREQAVGDAHLIAAAPELYEALEIAIKDGPVGYLEWIEVAKDALAKARGEK